MYCNSINQNDQHGGQPIPNFDYGMAIGVKKTYKKLYRENLKKAIELILEDIDLEENLDNIFKVLEEEYSLVPTIDNNQEYRDKEKEYLKELINDERLIGRIQKFTEKNALKDTERRTYQQWSPDP